MKDLNYSDSESDSNFHSFSDSEDKRNYDSEDASDCEVES